MYFVPEGQHDRSQARSAWSHEENSPVPLYMDRGPAPQGLQDSAQGFNPGNPHNKRCALKGREMPVPDEARTYRRAKVRVRQWDGL
jgi:hypothetical protein